MSWLSWFTLSLFGSRAVTAKGRLSTPLSTSKRGYSRYGRLVGNIAWVWACIRDPKRQGSLSQGVVPLADGFSRVLKGGHRDPHRQKSLSLWFPGIVCDVERLYHRIWKRSDGQRWGQHATSRRLAAVMATWLSLSLYLVLFPKHSALSSFQKGLDMEGRPLTRALMEVMGCLKRQY